MKARAGEIEPYHRRWHSRQQPKELQVLESSHACWLHAMLFDVPAQYSRVDPRNTTFFMNGKNTLPFPLLRCLLLNWRGFELLQCYCSMLPNAKVALVPVSQSLKDFHWTDISWKGHTSREDFLLVIRLVWFSRCCVSRTCSSLKELVPAEHTRWPRCAMWPAAELIRPNYRGPQNGNLVRKGNMSDDSLESLLTEALFLLELRFESFDVDGVGYDPFRLGRFRTDNKTVKLLNWSSRLNFWSKNTDTCIYRISYRTISLEELIQGLSISGFVFRKEDIQNIFNYVDVDQSGALDFAEVPEKYFPFFFPISSKFVWLPQFFALIYLWTEKHKAAIAYFFRIPQNQEVITSSFERLVAVMKRYDADQSRRLSRTELDQMFEDLFPHHVRSGHYLQVVDTFFPDPVTSPPRRHAPAMLPLLPGLIMIDVRCVCRSLTLPLIHADIVCCSENNLGCASGLAIAQSLAGSTSLRCLNLQCVILSCFVLLPVSVFHVTAPFPVSTCWRNCFAVETILESSWTRGSKGSGAVWKNSVCESTCICTVLVDTDAWEKLFNTAWKIPRSEHHR